MSVPASPSGGVRQSLTRPASASKGYRIDPGEYLTDQRRRPHSAKISLQNDLSASTLDSPQDLEKRRRGGPKSSEARAYEQMLLVRVRHANELAGLIKSGRTYRAERSAEGDIRIQVLENDVRVREISGQLFDKEYHSLKGRAAHVAPRIAAAQASSSGGGGGGGEKQAGEAGPGVRGSGAASPGGFLGVFRDSEVGGFGVGSSMTMTRTRRGEVELDGEAYQTEKAAATQAELKALLHDTRELTAKLKYQLHILHEVASGKFNTPAVAPQKEERPAGQPTSRPTSRSALPRSSSVRLTYRALFSQSSLAGGGTGTPKPAGP
eukprot:tig00000144_g9104.t1